ncbi:MAG: tetratricopeptide repeat protein [Desulfuromusa sp.]|jgi:Tfp pilus assembly protein PilF|nr:tetratricopeptide repeat protein [Desulfuromusa sp.]
MFHSQKIFIVIIMLGLFACVPVSQEAQQELNQADVHYKLAMAHLQGDNPTLALKELLVAVEQDPKNSSIQVALAQTYQRKKAYPQAEKHYLKALELSDNDPRYQNNLASLYLDLGEWDKAIHYFDQASMNLLFVNAHVAVAGKGYAYFKKMDYPTALNYLNESIILAPRFASAYFLKSEVYQAMGDSDQEKISLQRAIEIAPQFTRARYQLAVLLLEDNLVDEAVEQLKTIIEYSPTSELGHKAKGLLKSLPDS